MKAHISQRLNVNPAAVCHCIVGYRPHSILCKSRYIPFTILDIWEYAPKHCWEKKWERVLARLELSTRLYSCLVTAYFQNKTLTCAEFQQTKDETISSCLIFCCSSIVSSPHCHHHHPHHHLLYGSCLLSGPAFHNQYFYYPATIIHPRHFYLG